MNKGPNQIFLYKEKNPVTDRPEKVLNFLSAQTYTICS